MSFVNLNNHLAFTTFDNKPTVDLFDSALCLSLDNVMLVFAHITANKQVNHTSYSSSWQSMT